MACRLLQKLADEHAQKTIVDNPKDFLNKVDYKPQDKKLLKQHYIKIYI